MLKIKMLWFFCFVFLSLQAQKNVKLDFLLEKLHDGGKSDYVMIFAHRGDWRNAPENSLQAFQNCIDAGLDGIEIDVQRTKDDQLVVIHDKTLDRTTNGKGDVKNYTLEELKKLRLKSPIGVVTNYEIPTLKETLQLTRGKILIQVDKWPGIENQIIKEAEEEECMEQLIFRASWDSKRVKKTLGRLYDKITYIPVLVSRDETDDQKLDDFLKSLKTPVISFSFVKDDTQVLNRIDEVKKYGYRIWLNSLQAKFNGGHDDELAVHDLDSSYGWLLEKGGDIIFTDRPFLLKEYLENKGRR